MKKRLLQLLFLANLLVIFYFWHSNSWGFIKEGTFAGICVALGRIAGLLAEFFILVQLVLIARIRWIERQFGHDELTAIHKFIGTYIIILLFSHPILLTIGWGGMTETPFLQQFVGFVTDWHDVFNALIGLVIFSIAITLSLTIFRNKLKYERWHFSHLFIYIAIALALEHQTNTGDMTTGTALYYWLAINYIVFGLMLVYRFLRPSYLFYRHRFTVEKVVAESKDVWSLYITGKKLDKFNFDAGQFAIINIIKKGMWTSHPFSFSSAPNGKYVRFTIKALGDFTNKIKDVVPGTKVLIDGPLGTFTEHRSKTNRYLFIAGGVGITPIAGMIDSLTRKSVRDITLLYCVRSAAQIPFRDVFDALPIKTYYIVSDAGAGDSGKQYFPGRLDKEKIDHLVPDFLDRDIFFCGPPNMSTPIIKMLDDAGVKKGRLHFEKFSF